MKKAKNKPLEGGFSFSGMMHLRPGLVTSLTEQDKVQKFVLESIFGRYNEPQRVNELPDTWRLWCEVQGDVKWWKEELVKHPQVELVEVIEHGKSWFEGIFRFTQPPRITYGDGDAENARLRAAGLAIVTELETIAHTDEYKCPGCNRVFTWQDHGADCPTRVFTDGTE